MARTKSTKTKAKPAVSKEVAAAIKNFKQSEDVTNFYQFIHENNLRTEAHQIMATVLKTMMPVKKRGRKKILQ